MPKKEVRPAGTNLAALMCLDESGVRGTRPGRKKLEEITDGTDSVMAKALAEHAERQQQALQEIPPGSASVEAAPPSSKNGPRLEPAHGAAIAAEIQLRHASDLPWMSQPPVSALLGGRRIRTTKSPRREASRMFLDKAIGAAVDACARVPRRIIRPPIELAQNRLHHFYWTRIW